MLSCPKFQLDREDELDTPHFISAVDGSLFMPGRDSLHSHDDYCVDYYYIKDEFDPSKDVIRVG